VEPLLKFMYRIYSRSVVSFKRTATCGSTRLLMRRVAEVCGSLPSTVVKIRILVVVEISKV